MKKLVLLVSVSIAVFVSGCGFSETATNSRDSGQTVEADSNPVSVEEAAKTALKSGDTMPPFELPNANGQVIRSDQLLKEKNLVLVFYRGGWCPYCNTYLKKLQDNLSEIDSSGGALVAISAENPDDSLTTAQKHELRFHVLSDRQLSYARKFRLVYQIPEKTDQRYKGKGIDLVVDNEMDKPELPISATYIVNQKGKIVYDFVEPDYKKRATPEEVIGQLKKLAS